MARSIKEAKKFESEEKKRRIEIFMNKVMSERKPIRPKSHRSTILSIEESSKKAKIVPLRRKTTPHFVNPNFLRDSLSIDKDGKRKLNWSIKSRNISEKSSEPEKRTPQVKDYLKEMRI